MKKILLLLATTCSLCMLHAQTSGSSNKGKPVLDPSVVPSNAITSFQKENPNEEVTWVLDGKNYKAEYVDDSNASHARIYDTNGNILFRDDEMNSYPTPISDYYSKTYPGEGYMIWSRIDNNGVNTYYAFRDGETIWFDKNGKCMNPKKSRVKPNSSIKMQ